AGTTGVWRRRTSGRLRIFCSSFRTASCRHRTAATRVCSRGFANTSASIRAAQSWRSIARASAGCRARLTQRPSAARHTAWVPEQGLELRGLTKRYGNLLAGNDLSFDMRPGQLFGFVGSNGAGKTTTMRIVLGVLLPDKGEVRWAGRPMDFETRRRIGYMPEERGLYPKMHAGEQLVYLGQLHGLTEKAAVASARRWLDRFELTQRANDDIQKLSHGN